MSSFEIFKKSHSFYIKEKYLSILKELEHLQGASMYYNTLTDEEYKYFSELTDNIQQFKNYIKSIYNSKEYSLQEIEKSCYLHTFIILLDIQNKKIEKFLKYFSSLHKKLLQLVSETLPHHVPTPSIGKRYSSKVLSDYLQKNANKLYKFLLTEEEKSEIHLYWDHVDHYKLDGYISKSFLEMNPMRFVSHSFYYHDIVWNIPTLIDREVILHAMKSKKYEDNRTKFKNKLFNSLKELKDTVKNDLINIKIKMNTDDYIISFIEAFKKETFLVEIMSDIIGLKIHGRAYVLSFLHETLGRSYGREYHISENDGLYSSIPYYCLPERDTQIVRQHILLTMYLKISNDDCQYLKEAHKLLEFLCHGRGDDVSDPKKKISSFNKKEHVNTHKAYCAMMGKIIDIVFQVMKDINRQIKLFPEYPNKEYMDNTFIRESGKGIRYIHVELWEERFKLLEINSIPHKSILRHKILEKEYEDVSSMHPYVLKFEKEIREIDDVSSKTDIAFGLFDAVKIDSCEVKIDINSEIRKLFEKDIKCFKFIHKHSLIKIKEYGDLTKAPYKLYILITLKNTFDFEGMKEIARWCDEREQGIVYYKSLGPQDIVLECNCESKDHLWETLGSLRKEKNSYISKTYSVIVADDNNNDHKLDIKVLCTVPTNKDVSEIRKNIYTNTLFADKGWKKNEWDKKMVFHNTIGRKSFELNLYRVSLRELTTLVTILKKNKDLVDAEYFFMNKI